MRTVQKEEKRDLINTEEFAHAIILAPQLTCGISSETSLIGTDLGKSLGKTLIECADHLPITLIPAAKKISVADLRKIVPDGDIVVCDFYIDQIEATGSQTGIGIPQVEDAFGTILNIDHHAPIQSMEKPVSSGNLAIAQVTSHEPTSLAVPVIINHTDCDSVISSLIVRGILPPLEQFSTAVICADHTGEANQIADLLQSLEPRRDLAFSVRNLGLLLSGEPLEVEAQELLEHRLLQRIEVEVLKVNFKSVGPVSFALIEDRVPGELLQSVLSDSGIIVLGRLLEEGSNILQVSVRLGNAAAAGITLPSLKINEFDRNFGGRWNAGANKRGGGFIIPEQSSVAAELYKYATYLAKSYSHAFREQYNLREDFFSEAVVLSATAQQLETLSTFCPTISLPNGIRQEALDLISLGKEKTKLVAVKPDSLEVFIVNYGIDGTVSHPKLEGHEDFFSLADLVSGNLPPWRLVYGTYRAIASEIK